MHWIDPDCLPETRGTLQRFLLNPHGDLDGMVLEGGIEVHFPRHMADAVQALVGPGDDVHVRGVRPRGAPMLAAVCVESARGERASDAGPPEHEEKRAREKRHESVRAKRKYLTEEGTLSMLVHGPKGEVRGALLEEGMILRWPPHASDEMKRLLRKGAPIAVSGEALKTKHGTVIDVHEMGASREELRRLSPKGPRHAHHEPRARKHR